MKDIETVLNRGSDDWSAYCDEGWEGNAPGTYTMQPRVLHVLCRLAYEPRRIPASNLVFPRSSRAADLQDFSPLAKLCWPFHRAVIEHLGVRVILCFGQRCGTWVRRRLEAHSHVDAFIENNKRRWKSSLFSNSRGLMVVTASHPSIADWTAPSSDPTPLVQAALRRVRHGP